MAVTFLALVRAVAQALDDEGTYNVASGASTTVTVAPLVNSTANASTHRYDGRWLYVASGAGSGQQRVVKPGGYTPSTGMLEVTNQFATAPSAGDIIVLTSLFPVADTLVAGEDASYRGLINRGIAKLLVPRRLTLTITTGDSYSLSAWPWLDRPTRLLRVLEPAIRSGLQPVDASWRGPKLVVNGGSNLLTLNSQFDVAGGNLTLETLSPASRWINGAESAGGLVAATDTAEVTIEEGVAVTLVEAYQALATRSVGAPNGDWEKKWAAQREIAREMAYYDDTLLKPAAPSQEAA